MMLRVVLPVIFNSIVPNALFLYPLETSENRKVLWCFQGVEKGCIRNKWVNGLKRKVVTKNNKNKNKKNKTNKKQTQTKLKVFINDLLRTL